MAGPAVDIKAFVSRLLPSLSPDDPENTKSVRSGRYREIYVIPSVRKAHVLADEGSYFVTNAGQVAITGQSDTAFNAIHPSISIANSDGANGKRIHIDYLHLLAGGTAFTNATSNTALFLAVVLDQLGNGAITGGTDLTPNIVVPNGDITRKSSVALVRAGALVAPAASAQARTVVGQRLLRLPVSATALTLANVDEFSVNFGGVEATPPTGSQASATVEATKVSRSLAVPPIIVAPGWVAYIYLTTVAAGAITPGNWLPELGFWER